MSEIESEYIKSLTFSTAKSNAILKRFAHELYRKVSKTRFLTEGLCTIINDRTPILRRNVYSLHVLFLSKFFKFRTTLTAGDFNAVSIEISSMISFDDLYALSVAGIQSISMFRRLRLNPEPIHELMDILESPQILVDEVLKDENFQAQEITIKQTCKFSQEEREKFSNLLERAKKKEEI